MNPEHNPDGAAAKAAVSERLSPADEQQRFSARFTREKQRQEQREQAERNRQLHRFDDAGRSAMERISVLPAALRDVAPLVKTGEAMAAAVSAVQQNMAALRAVAESPYLTSTQIALAVADRAEKSLNDIHAGLEAEALRLERLAADVEVRGRTALTAPAHMKGEMAELRSVLRTMTDAQRATLLERAKGEEALMLMHAIASLPPFMSGASIGQHRNAVDMLYGLRDPALLELVPGVPKARAAIAKAIAALPTLYADAVDFKAAKALRGEV